MRVMGDKVTVASQLGAVLNTVVKYSFVQMPDTHIMSAHVCAIDVALLYALCRMVKKYSLLMLWSDFL
jgi:hypothetical protein